MIEIGKVNTLTIVCDSNYGLYLDAEEEGEILLPNKYVPSKFEIGDQIDVFVSYDSDDRIFASTETPVAMVGEFACLEVVAATKFGAFLDWGMPKDLLVPFKEQNQRMQTGEKHVVYIYFDTKSRRIAATAKLFKYLSADEPNYAKGDEVEIMIVSESDLGYNALVDKKYMGLLFKSDVFKQINIGDKLNAFIKEVREDGKIDLRLTKAGKSALDDFAEQILTLLNDNGGFLAITDKSSSETINALFGQSKKMFKKAVGMLYKQRKITIEENGIRLS